VPHDPSAAIEGVPTGTAALLGEAAKGPVAQPVLVTSLTEFQRTFGAPVAGSELFLGVSQFFANGGRRAWIVRLRGGGVPAVRRGLSALEIEDDVGLLCLPGLTGGRVLAAAAAAARKRGAFYLADPEASRAATVDALRRVPPADAAYMAVHFPRLLVTDPLKPSATHACGPAATVAGVMARLDRDRGVWAAAAGTDVRVQGAVGPASTVSAAVADRLRAEGINPIREIPGHGLVLWGARAAGGSGEWRYVPVRRLALYLEHSIDRGLGWVVFEPNDEPTWSRVRAAVEAFLDGVFQAGALAGPTPATSFYVRCGADTMTQRDIDRGILNVEVGVAPLRPAEFVHIRIRRPAR